MFEALTKYIEPLEDGEFQLNIDDDGYPSYSSTAEDMMDAVDTFSNENPSFNMQEYYEILHAAEIEITGKSFSEANIEEQTAEVVLAILIASARAERITEGAWDMAYESGVLLRVLKRLKELDV